MYDITEIFQDIENKLISSMCKNLSRHIDEEQDAQANYPQWQTKQLQALERYRKENLKEFSKQFEDINNSLKKYLEMTYNNSKTATEHDIISNLDRNSDAIGVNQERLNALIKSVTNDFQKAEYSLLRRSNDLYRQTIYKAQVGLNTGSMTLNQAIDMATKDFLSAGINSIRYKNGNLVNIASYSEMALRTAEKRATMYGDGEKRQEWDISTVVVYGHNGACPLCARWQNRVYIDDVYSNGKPNNKYPLLSVAIQGGLYHPNCKCPPPQTYIEGITEPPTQKAPQGLEKDIQNYNLEQVQRYNERQIRKYKRLEANSLDENNRKKYAIKVQEWQSKQREFIKSHPEQLRRDYSREKVRVLNITEPPKNATKITPIVQNSLTSTQNSGNIKKREYIKIKGVEHLNKILSKSEKNFLSKITDEDRMSIDYYTSSGSFELNGVLRKTNGYHLNEENKLHIEALERIINKYKLDTDIVTYRAIPYDIVRELKIGDIYTDKGFQSTTPLKFVVNNFAEENDLNSILEIQVKAQENVGAYINSLSQYRDEEYEFLLNKELKFEVIDIYYDENNRKVIKMVML